MKIPKIEYDVYYKENENHLVELNLNYCKDFRSNLLIPVEINENLDILNSSGGYYNDICYTTKSDSGSDIILKDRKNDFIYHNKTVCQEDCIFTDYNKDTKKAICSCKIKEPSLSSANMNIDINKIMKSFIDIKNIANIALLKCYKKLFSLKDIIKNIGFLMIIPIIIFNFLCIIIFYCKQYKKLKKKIKKIIISREALYSSKKNVMILNINNNMNNLNFSRNKNNKEELEQKSEIYKKKNNQLNLKNKNVQYKKNYISLAKFELKLLN